MKKADSLELWNSARWKRILLYRNHFYGKESDVDGGFFFLSLKGKTNPREEMFATMRGLFHERDIYASQDTLAGSMHCQVKYPLRFHYLKSSLGIPDSEFPVVDQSRFDRWIKALDPGHLSVVFASAYLGNPASAMGHTFLRIHSRKNVGQRELLDYGINYAGNTPAGENKLFYSLKGIFGFYPGTYGLLPYYVSLQQYLHIENRDLWYYHLHLGEQQQWDLLAHLWEQGNSWEHYFFFTENCSYYLASLVNIALPDSVDLMDSLPYAMVPSETMKAMLKVPGLVDSITWRPPTLTKVRDQYDAMTPVQQQLTKDILFGNIDGWDAQIQKAALSSEDLAFVYDAALDYSLVKKRSQEDGAEWERRNAMLLERRTQIHMPPHFVEHQIDSTQLAPHRVHDPYRFEVGGGGQEYKAFGTLGFRISYQDANQYDEGLKPNSVLDFMDLRLRFWENHKVRMEMFRILQMASYPTRGDLLYPNSFRLDLRIDRPPMKNLDPSEDPLSPYMSLATGKAWDFWGHQVLVGFGTVGGRLRLHPEYDDYMSLGPMLNSGLKWRPTRWCSILLTAEMTYGILGEREWELHHEAELRLGGPSFELRLGGSQWNHRNESFLRFLVNY